MGSATYPPPGFKFMGWVDEDDHFHPDNDGNRYIFSADAYDWIPVFRKVPA